MGPFVFHAMKRLSDITMTFVVFLAFFPMKVVATTTGMLVLLAIMLITSLDMRFLTCSFKVLYCPKPKVLC